MHISYPLSFPNLRPKAKHCKYFCKNCCTLCASPLITMGPISTFHVSIIIGVLSLDGNSSLMPEVENTPCNCYKVDMGTSTLEAPVPCAFKVPSTSSNISKILDAKKIIRHFISPLETWIAFKTSITLSLHENFHSCQGCLACLGSLDVTPCSCCPLTQMYLS